VPFHTAMIFVLWEFHLKNNVLSPGLTRFNSFLNYWHMPLLFLLSGAGTWFALEFRSGREYAKERFLRLFVPLVFGMLAIVPPQMYVERLWRHQFSGSFFRFWPSVLTTGPYPQGNLSWHHLWFMLYLFLFSMIALPLFLSLKSERGRPGLAKLEAWFGKGRRILLPFVIFSGGQIAFGSTWPNGDQNLIHDLDNFSLHFLMFVVGFILFSGDGYRRAFERNRAAGLAIGAVISGGLITTEIIGVDPSKLNIVLIIGMLGLRGLCTWCWLVAFLGYGSLRLNFTNSVRVYAAEAALPFYIMHQTVILILGYRVIQLDASIPVKYTTIVVLTYIITLLLYDLLVKRIRILRFLFGMRINKK
jgi:glucans biosynthesis protein C